MSVSAGLLPEFNQEMERTRRVLERVPVDHATWKPHAKSFALGALAVHVSELVTGIFGVIREHELDLSAASPPDRSLDSTQSLLDQFDARVADARAALMAASDESFEAPWTLRVGDRIVFSLPRLAVYRSMAMNHLIHHRAQLTVYLRMLDVPVPSLYGRSEDERLPFG